MPSISGMCIETNKKKLPLGTFDIDGLAKLLHLPEFEFESSGETFSHIFNAAIEAGESAVQAEVAALDAELEEEREVYSHWKEAVMFIAEGLCEQHGLTLHEHKNHTYAFRATSTWSFAAQKIARTINGVGMFHYSSVKEFVDVSSCKNEREAVLSHLHWLHKWYEVYEGHSSKTAFRRTIV